MNTSGERAVPEEDIEQVLAQILRLVDVTRDIERNIDDARFDAAGGRMHYVFDENVFEMFVNPKRWKSRTATFHSPFWLRRAGEPPSRNWSSIAAQSALIASEFLFSGTLPGQRTSDIYMTEWHSWELRDRVGDLTVGGEQQLLVGLCGEGLERLPQRLGRNVEVDRGRRHGLRQARRRGQSEHEGA